MTQIHPSQIGMTLGTKLALVLFAALILSLDADLTYARNAAAQAGSRGDSRKICDRRM